MKDDGHQTTNETLRCPYCLQQATVRITRHATMSRKHVDLECKCERCGEKWQAAEIANAR